MDCEKYDKIAMDLLYDELDELSAASAKRHLDQCARCRDIHARLRATRDVGTVPLVALPEGFEQRVLAAEAEVRQELPLRQRFGRTVSILAGYAMRPQLAMAALLLLMIGSSLIFLRARPGQHNSVMVTERGMPESEGDSIILPASPPAALEAERAPAAAPEPLELAKSAAASGSALAKAERKASAKGAPAATAPAPGAAAKPVAREQAQAADRARDDEGFAMEAEDTADSAAEALAQAKQLQQSSGCSAAAPKFEEVGARYPGTGAATEATWRAAECRRLLGDFGRARQGYTLLLEIPAYSERARAGLAKLGGESSASEAPVASKKTSRPATAAGSAPVAEPSAPAKSKANAAPAP